MQVCVIYSQFLLFNSQIFIAFEVLISHSLSFATLPVLLRHVLLEGAEPVHGVFLSCCTLQKQELKFVPCCWLCLGS